MLVKYMKGIIWKNFVNVSKYMQGISRDDALGLLEYWLSVVCGNTLRTLKYRRKNRSWKQFVAADITVFTYLVDPIV